MTVFWNLEGELPSSVWTPFNHFSILCCKCVSGWKSSAQQDSTATSQMRFSSNAFGFFFLRIISGSFLLLLLSVLTWKISYLPNNRNQVTFSTVPSHCTSVSLLSFKQNQAVHSATSLQPPLHLKVYSKALLEEAQMDPVKPLHTKSSWHLLQDTRELALSFLSC